MTSSDRAMGLSTEGGRIPDDVVDAFFDRELDDASRERFFSGLRSDLPRCAEVAKTQRLISMLREPVDTPDLTERIMGGLADRGAFVPRRARRLILGGRWAAAAGIGFLILGLALAERYAPGALRFAPRPEPVTHAVRDSATEAAAGVEQLSQAMNIAAARIVEPESSARATRPPRGMISLSLSPGSAAPRLPAPGSGSLVIYTGSGNERFIVPDAYYIDHAGAMVLPLGHISPSRAGLDWAAISPENPFLLPSVAPAGSAAADAPVKVRVVKP